MNLLCKQLAGKVKANHSLTTVLFHCASSILLKDAVKDKPSGPLYTNQRDAIVSLFNGVAPPVGEDQDWAARRSRACRLAMLLTKRVKTFWIPNFKIEKVYMNVPFPPNMSSSGVPRGFASGGDPAEITDPITRAAYEAAIKQNSEKVWRNGAQRDLDDIVKTSLPKLEIEIIRMYSVPPVAFEEITEYLELGGFTNDERLRIISSIAQKIQTQPPAGLLNNLKD